MLEGARNSGLNPCSCIFRGWFWWADLTPKQSSPLSWVVGLRFTLAPTRVGCEFQADLPSSKGKKRDKEWTGEPKKRVRRRSAA